MRICFLSNYFNHHQKPISDALFEKTSGNYYFVATGEISEWRKQLGYKEMNAPYVLEYGKDNENGEIDRIILDSDVVILGAADISLVKKRLIAGKLTYLCTERIYWKNIPWYRLLSHYCKFYWWYRRFDNFYLLCASAYTSSDFLRTGTFKDKAYKWGYFPERIKYHESELIIRKEKNNTESGYVSILWVGRLIDWKHPEACLFLAERLKSKGCHFKISVIGTGSMEAELKAKASEMCLSAYIDFMGAMPPEEVRSHMENNSIFISTSDEQEGWGAVLNEAMNSACAVVASNAMGAAPYLISNGSNGYLFNSLDWDTMASKVDLLIKDVERRKSVSINAYRTIARAWNAETAATRLICLSSGLLENIKMDYVTGPCSKA